MECLLKNKNTGIVLVVAAAVLWSTAGAFVKLIDMEALTLSATRSVFAALVLLPFLRPRQVGWNRYLPVIFILYALTCGSFLMGLRYTNATNAVALHFTSPLWIYAWSLAQGRKIRRQELLPMLCIICGIIICIMEPKAGTSRLGNMTALFSGITFAAFAICLPKNGSQNNVGVICLANIFAAFFLYACAVVFTPVNIIAEFAAVSTPGWFAIIAL
ncbi:MAG: DMT family transporter, partial [Clostridia bacterium]|nr:DMT family transporter [Clostridia bacterium]